MKVLVVDYGLGNLRSVKGAVEKLGHEAIISNDTSEALRADKIILPGVGAFGDGMDNLRKMNWVPKLEEAVLGKKKPILGICLGAQLLAQSSNEFGDHKGLGWVNAAVTRIEPTQGKLRVPHVGWNELKQKSPSILFENIPEDALFYYVHSYWIQSKEEQLCVGECDYGSKFTAVLERENIFGTQFHPEKSQLHGLELLKNFLEKT